MKRFTLSLAAAALAILLSLNASPAQAHGRRVVVVGSPAYARVVRPIVPVVRPRMITAYPYAAYPYAVNYAPQPVVVIPQQPYWGYVPTFVGTPTYVGW